MTISTGTCPGCDFRLELRGDLPRDGMLACPQCATLFAFPQRDGDTRALVSTPVETERALVLVAHESEEFLATARTVLAEGGFESLLAADGASARAALEAHDVVGLVLDVALPGAFSFDWIPDIRADPRTKDVKVILVASVYDRTAYKRKPSDLQGADDYVEQHHVADSLVEKLDALLTGVPIPEVHRVDKTLTEVVASRTASIEDAARSREQRLAASSGAELELARLVVADLHLYQGAAPDSTAVIAAKDEVARRLGSDADHSAVEAAVAQALGELRRAPR